jgi:inner membrane protein
MLIRTHLVITLFFVLLFISNVENKLLFCIVALIVTFIPDIDSKHSKIGRRKVARVLQFFTKHRGIFHSFSFLVLVLIFLEVYLPNILFPFFVGYCSHLFADCFTPRGVRVFYPLKFKVYWKIRTGGRFEFVVFIFFVLVNLSLIGNFFISLFF